MTGGTMSKIIRSSILQISIILATAAISLAQGTEFSYQGNLADGVGPANGSYDFEFALFDSLTGGLQVGSVIAKNNVSVGNGVFSVQLDFGNQFPGTGRFLEIRVRPTGQPGFTALVPRQPISSQPYSVKSLSAETAVNALQLGGVAANQYVLTGDVRLSDARNPLPGSASYIQNGTTPQASSNFNVSGTGTANIFNASTQFNIGNVRFLSAPGSSTIGGIFAGINSTGPSNSFFGREAGRDNTTGDHNTMVGFGAGAIANGFANSFFGSGAGFEHAGNSNSFFGFSAGSAAGSGGGNSFFGKLSGRQNTTGFNNVFVGIDSGLNNNIGNNNVFIGSSAGVTNLVGSGNTAIGANADFLSNAGSNATAIGNRAFAGCSPCLVLGSVNGANGATENVNVGIGTTQPSERLHVVGNSVFTGNLTVSGTLNATLPVDNVNYILNQTAGPQASSNFFISGNGTANGTIGANVINAQTHYALGGGRVLAVGNLSVSVGIDSGSLAAGVANSFFGSAAGTSITTGSLNSFFGRNAGSSSTDSTSNSFFGSDAGSANIGSLNTFVGKSAGEANQSSGNNSFFGVSAGQSTQNSGATTLLGAFTSVSEGVSNSTAIGFRASVTQNNSLVLGSINGINSATADTNVGIGTTAPLQKLHVVGNGLFTGNVVVGNSNGQLLSNPGANTSPSWSFNGDGSTGIFRPAVGTIAFTSSGTERIRLTSTGNFGIGTATPGHALTIGNIVGNPAVTTNAKVAVFGNNNSYGIFRDITNGVETIVGADLTTTDGTVGSAIFGTATNHGVIFKTNGITRMTITPSGIVGISSLGAAGTTALCRNAQNLIGNCSSSARYKNNIQGFSSGIDLIRRLRPVTFNWKDGGIQDLGLVAEEVAKIEPLLTTTNDKGEIEGVKYDRIGVVLVNAMNEQQMRIEKLDAKISSQKEMIDRQQIEIRLLKDLLCSLEQAASSVLCRDKP